MVAWTYDGDLSTASFNIYVDGVVQPLTGWIVGSAGPTSNPGQFDIGSRDGANELFIGNLDDIYIFNRVLSAAEIQDIYNAQR